MKHPVGDSGLFLSRSKGIWFNFVIPLVATEDLFCDSYLREINSACNRHDSAKFRCIILDLNRKFRRVHSHLLVYRNLTHSVFIAKTCEQSSLGGKQPRRLSATIADSRNWSQRTSGRWLNGSAAPCFQSRRDFRLLHTSRRRYDALTDYSIRRVLKTTRS